MTPTVYTFGDFETILWGLHGVAALFDPSNGNLILGHNLLGLGAAVGLGCLIVMLVGLVRGIMGQSLNVHEVFIGIIIFTMLFVPKTRLQIEDYPTGRVAVVDHLPMGLAYAASGLSSAFVGLAERIDAVFQMADSYYPTLSQEHFLSSLNLLASIDWTVEGVKRAMPRMASNLDMYLQYCIDTQQISPKKILQEAGGATGILDYPRAGGLVMYFKEDGTQEFTNCPGLSARIQSDIALIFSAPPASEKDFVKLVTRGIDSAKVGEAADSSTESYTEKAVDALESLKTAAQVGMSDSTSDLMALVYGKYIQSSLRCAYEPSPADYANCVIREGETLYRRMGSMFARSQGILRGLMDNMSKLAFVFYATSPVVALVIGLLGLRGVKAAGAWLVMGINAHAPLILAPVGNFYAWKQAVASMKAVTSGTGITIANVPAVIESLMNAVDNGMSVMDGGGLLLISLITGSGMMLSRLVSRGGLTDSIATAASRGSGTGLNLYSPASMFTGTSAATVTGSGMWNMLPSGWDMPPGGGPGVFGGPSVGASGQPFGHLGGGYPWGNDAGIPSGTPVVTLSTSNLSTQMQKLMESSGQQEGVRATHAFTQAQKRAYEIAQAVLGKYLETANHTQGKESTSYVGQSAELLEQRTMSTMVQQAMQTALETISKQGKEGSLGANAVFGLPGTSNLSAGGKVAMGTQHTKTSGVSNQESSGQQNNVTASDRTGTGSRTSDTTLARLTQQVAQELVQDKHFRDAMERAVMHQEAAERAFKQAKSYEEMAASQKSMGYSTKVNVAEALSRAIRPGSDRYAQYSAMMAAIQLAEQADPKLAKTIQDNTERMRRLGYGPGMDRAMAAIQTIANYVPSGQESAAQLERTGKAMESVLGFLLGTSSAGFMPGFKPQEEGQKFKEQVEGKIKATGREIGWEKPKFPNLDNHKPPELPYTDPYQFYTEQQPSGGLGVGPERMRKPVESILDNIQKTLKANLDQAQKEAKIPTERLKSMVLRPKTEAEQKAAAALRAYNDFMRERMRIEKLSGSGFVKEAGKLVAQYGERGHRDTFNRIAQLANLGSLSTKEESNNDPGAVGSLGRRAAYGLYQIDSKTGPLKEFVNFLRNSGDSRTAEYGHRLAYQMEDAQDPKGNFAKEWRSIAMSDPQGFAQMQQQFIQGHYIEPLKQGLAEKGINFSSLGRGTQEALISGAIQHGVKGVLGLVDKSKGALERGDENGFVRDYYQQRIWKYAGPYEDSPEDDALRQRYAREQQLVSELNSLDPRPSQSDMQEPQTSPPLAEKNVDTGNTEESNSFGPMNLSMATQPSEQPSQAGMPDQPYQVAMNQDMPDQPMPDQPYQVAMNQTSEGVLNTGDGGVLNTSHAEFSTPFSNDLTSLTTPSDTSSEAILAMVQSGSGPHGEPINSTDSSGVSTPSASQQGGAGAVPGDSDSSSPGGQKLPSRVA